MQTHCIKKGGQEGEIWGRTSQEETFEFNTYEKRKRKI